MGIPQPHDQADSAENSLSRVEPASFIQLDRIDRPTAFVPPDPGLILEEFRAMCSLPEVSRRHSTTICPADAVPKRYSITGGVA